MRRYFAFVAALIFLLSLSVVAQQEEREKGFESYQAGDFVKAAEYFEKAVGANEADKGSWLYLGASYLHLKERKKARAAFSFWEKVKLSPDQANPFVTEAHKMTKRTLPRSNEDVRRKYDSARAKVVLELRNDGTVGFIHILMNTAYEWEPEVINAAKSIQFEPATKGGAAVTTIIMLEYTLQRF